MENPPKITISDKISLQNIFNVLKPVNITEIILFILLMTAIYVITALIFYNQVQLDINRKSQCYLSRKAVTSTGAFTATAQNEKGNSLYKISYDMPSKSYSVDCACPAGPVTNTYPNVDVYNLQTQKTMRLTNKICGCDKQYYSPGYNQIYFSGYPGVTRYMNTASLVTDASEIQAKADTSFFQSALNPREYYNTY
jgi:hypothetical protein